MQTKSEHLRKNILIPLLFVLVVLLVASVTSLFAIQRLHILSEINSKIREVKNLFPTLIEVESDLLSAQIDFLMEKKSLQESWQTGDRNQLQHEATTYFTSMRSKYNVTHFYFISPEQICFLRAHNPTRHGDFIKRTTMNAAKRKMRPARGIELGPLGTFTLRVVHPWFIDGNHVGYIELGKEIHHVAPLLKSSLNVDLVFTIHKNLLQRDSWVEGMEMLGRSADWDLFPDSVVIDATIDTIPKEIGKRIGLPNDAHARDIIKISLGDTQLRGQLVTLLDAAAKDVGDILVLLDVTDTVASLKTITFYVLSFYILLGLILYIFMYFLLGITQEKLRTYQEDLLAEIKEHTKAEEELKVHRDKLEVMVQERTQELNDSLVKLKKEVHERELAEQALRLSEAQFRGVFEGSALGVTISDLKGHIITCNPAYKKMLGYTETELQEMNFSALTHSEDVRKHMNLYDELLAGKRDFFQAEKRYINKNGNIVWGQLTVSLVRDQDQNPLFVIGLIEDIGEKKELINERIKASKLESIGILAGGIAHDFNNLLTAIIGNITLAKKQMAPDNTAAKRLTEAEKAVLRTRDLTQQLLTFSKGGEPVKRAVPISDIIKDSATFALRGSSVRCEFDIPADLWRAKVDAGQFSQVIQNLAINAGHAMPEGGTLTISASNETVPDESGLPVSSGKYIKISVTDQGAGIAEDVIPRIFDPYFTTKEEGSGLGLSIVHSIIKNHDGLIQVESEPGQGTVFHIYLPAIARKKKPEQFSTEKIIYGSGKILLMDDEEMILDFASELLKELGYTVALAKDGEEAITLYKKAQKTDAPFAVILMDITIPGGMGGKEAIREILKLDENAKVIVSSGYAKDPIMSNYKEYGFVGVVPKPYKVEELSQELHRVLAG
jgi:PAS domain S-box-containing protein